MPAAEFDERTVEEAALQWFAEIGYTIGHGPDLEPGGQVQARATLQETILRPRLLDALRRINPGLPEVALDEAVRRVEQVGQPSLIATNRAFHAMLVNGVEVDVMTPDGVRGERVVLVDFDRPDANEFLAVNQVTVVGTHKRRPDVVVFVNGLPLAVIELKNMASESATITQAFNQLQTYMQQIPRLFHTNELLVISDGAQTEIGTITSGRERFAAWKTVDGEVLDQAGSLETAIKGVFEPGRFLDLIRHFIIFEDDGAKVAKKVAQYHQFHAVQKAVGTALQAAGTHGDGKGGVLWHTQGSGKSLTMLFFAGKLIRQPALANPTIVMITDRTDLDGQLFGTFSRGAELLRQQPVQATSRAHLRDLLSVTTGGVVFTTIQKFLNEDGEEQFPILSDRRNIIVMADEAHRTQYGLGNRVGRDGTLKAGLAQNMRDALPNATYVAFTGTPLELGDRSTQVVFGDYIDIYDVGRAIADKATVPIYYEGRQIRLELPEDAADLMDVEFDTLTEDREEAEKAQVASKWAQLEAVVGTERRLAKVAADLVQHLDQRVEANGGKVMIVTMSRRIAVDLYHQLAKLRPDWASDVDTEGAMKVIMTGSASDPLDWQPHIRDKGRRETLANRFKDPDDPFRIVIVRDMWLTGFDAPSLHTIYIDKPMKGHGLMQAIARVNRVFREKTGGLVVDYIGIATNLKEALRIYTKEDPGGKAPIQNDDEFNLAELIGAMKRELEYCQEAFVGFDYTDFIHGSPSERMKTVANAQDYLIREDWYHKGHIERFLNHATALRNAFALASATKDAQAIKVEVAFFQLMKVSIAKTTGRGAPSKDERLDHLVRQLVDEAVAPDGIVDVFAAAGLDKPNIANISDGFLDDVRTMPQRNLALEMLKKLLNDQIRSTRRSSIVQSRRFSERLEDSINSYNNRQLTMAQIIVEMIDLAKELRDDVNRGAQLGLSSDEYAFYEAIALSPSAKAVMSDDQLLTIAREVAQAVRNNASIDWRRREQVRARLRSAVRRVLRRLGYPPDQTENAAKLILEQAEALADAEFAA
ncbi:MAG: type I restriction endonuclease subunit R [Thermomicrobiales bacterium]